MASSPVLGTPGIRADRTATPRKVLLSEDYKVLYPGSRIIDGSKARDPGHTGNLDILRAGTLMGRITSGGKYAPCFMGQTAADYTSGGTSLNVGAATAVEIARRIGSSGTLFVVGAPTAGGTVVQHSVAFSAVNTSTGVLTITNIGANLDEGALIGATDGSLTPVAIIGDGYGIKVTDEDSASIDVPFVPMVIGGVLDVTKIPYFPASEDTTIRTWLKNLLCDAFYLSDDF